MLARLSDDMVRAKKQFFGQGPEQAKSYMLDDMLFVVMRGGLTTAEQTMLRFGQQNMVRQFRQLFENEMTEVLTGLVEETTGRTVVNYQSQIMFDPDIIVEMFVFADPRRDGIEATAEGQLEEERPARRSDAAPSTARIRCLRARDPRLPRRRRRRLRTRGSRSAHSRPRRRASCAAAGTDPAHHRRPARDRVRRDRRPLPPAYAAGDAGQARGLGAQR